ncbi:hypothetical protein FHS83_000380 [Rhizomicrobium palustre]|uniref:Outer membrane protein beta-barrel domain-containing protein n=1 Tax=Rhizomicrobium palustre TaxID=189966 RepID=A0A846MVD7_9PROT|nr:hypothetical protein [Rhizomicrobium palustre]NIK87062.1 hypothetical protein [Rhizomicrobium palustre]
MRFTMLMLGAAAIVATSANATDWTGFSGTVTGGYNYSDVKGASNHAYDFGGAANYAFPDLNMYGARLNVQGYADYSENRSKSIPVDTWASGGALTLRDYNYALGFAGGYNSSRALGVNAGYGNYGLIGEFYAMPDLTLRLRGGGISGNVGPLGGDGGYYGGGASYYVTPNLALNADASYSTVSSLHWSNFEIGPEYLISNELPVSVSAAYTQSNINALGRSLNSSGFMVRLAWHLGEGNSLVEYDRNGPLNLRNPQLPVNGLTSIAFQPK